MNRIFDDMLGAFTPSLRETAPFAPDIDISETDEEIRITADLPGVSEKDVEVSVKDNMLIITGLKRDEREEKGRDFHVTERSFGRFRRVPAAANSCDPETIRAEFDKGVLAIHAAKTEGVGGGPKVEVRPNNGDEQAH